MGLLSAQSLRAVTKSNTFKNSCGWISKTLRMLFRPKGRPVAARGGSLKIATIITNTLSRKSCFVERSQ